MFLLTRKCSAKLKSERGLKNATTKTLCELDALVAKVGPHEEIDAFHAELAGYLENPAKMAGLNSGP